MPISYSCIFLPMANRIPMISHCGESSESDFYSESFGEHARVGWHERGFTDYDRIEYRLTLAFMCDGCISCRPRADRLRLKNDVACM